MANDRHDRVEQADEHERRLVEEALDDVAVGVGFGERARAHHHEQPYVVHCHHRHDEHQVYDR